MARSSGAPPDPFPVRLNSKRDADCLAIEGAALHAVRAGGPEREADPARAGRGVAGRPGAALETCRAASSARSGCSSAHAPVERSQGPEQQSKPLAQEPPFGLQQMPPVPVPEQQSRAAARSRSSRSRCSSRTRSWRRRSGGRNSSPSCSRSPSPRAGCSSRKRASVVSQWPEQQSAPLAQPYPSGNPFPLQLTHVCVVGSQTPEQHCGPVVQPTPFGAHTHGCIPTPATATVMLVSQTPEQHCEPVVQPRSPVERQPTQVIVAGSQRPCPTGTAR